MSPSKHTAAGSTAGVNATQVSSIVSVLQPETKHCPNYKCIAGGYALSLFLQATGYLRLNGATATKYATTGRDR